MQCRGKTLKLGLPGSIHPDCQAQISLPNNSTLSYFTFKDFQHLPAMYPDNFEWAVE